MFDGIVNVCWIPFAGFISFLIILSAINKSVGVRKTYVNILLRIFEVIITIKYIYIAFSTFANVGTT